MPRKKKTETQEKFINEVNRFSKHEDYSVGDIVVYIRVSDEKKSVGEIKWFAMTSEGMGATLIDTNLGNFQLGLCKTFEENPSQERIKSMISKKRETSQKTK